MTVGMMRYGLLLLLSASICACDEEQEPQGPDAGLGCPADPSEPFSGSQNPVPGCPCLAPGEVFCCIGSIECAEEGVWGPYMDAGNACEVDPDSGVIPNHLECI